MQTSTRIDNKGDIREPLIHVLECKLCTIGCHHVVLGTSCRISDIFLAGHTPNSPFFSFFLQLPYLAHLALVTYSAAHHIIWCGERRQHTIRIGNIAHYIVFTFRRFINTIGVLANSSFDVFFRYIIYCDKLPFCCCIRLEGGINLISFCACFGRKGLCITTNKSIPIGFL